MLSLVSSVGLSTSAWGGPVPVSSAMVPNVGPLLLCDLPIGAEAQGHSFVPSSHRISAPAVHEVTAATALASGQQNA